MAGIPVTIVDRHGFILLEGACPKVPEELGTVPASGIKIVTFPRNREVIEKVLFCLTCKPCSDIPADFAQYIPESLLPDKYTLSDAALPTRPRKRAELQRRRTSKRTKKNKTPTDPATVEAFKRQVRAEALQPAPIIPEKNFTTKAHASYLKGAGGTAVIDSVVYLAQAEQLATKQNCTIESDDSDEDEEESDDDSPEDHREIDLEAEAVEQEEALAPSTSKDDLLWDEDSTEKIQKAAASKQKRFIEFDGSDEDEEDVDDDSPEVHREKQEQAVAEPPKKPNWLQPRRKEHSSSSKARVGTGKSRQIVPFSERNKSKRRLPTHPKAPPKKKASNDDVSYTLSDASEDEMDKKMPAYKKKSSSNDDASYCLSDESEDKMDKKVSARKTASHGSPKLVAQPAKVGASVVLQKGSTHGGLSFSHITTKNKPSISARYDLTKGTYRKHGARPERVRNQLDNVVRDRLKSTRNNMETAQQMSIPLGRSDSIDEGNSDPKYIRSLARDQTNPWAIVFTGVLTNQRPNENGNNKNGEVFLDKPRMDIQVGSEQAQFQVEEFLKNPLDIFTHNSYTTLLSTFSAKAAMIANGGEAEKKTRSKNKKKGAPGKKSNKKDEEDEMESSSGDGYAVI